MKLAWHENAKLFPANPSTPARRHGAVLMLLALAPPTPLHAQITSNTSCDGRCCRWCIRNYVTSSCSTNN